MSKNRFALPADVQKKIDADLKREKRANQNALNRELFSAIRAGDVDRLDLTLDSGAHIEARQKGATPLIFAVFWEKLDCLDVLIRRGAFLRAVNNSGRTPMMESILLNLPAFVRRLLEADPRLGMTPSNGLFNPLVQSAILGHIECARELLALGIEPKLSRSNGEEALIGAAEMGHADVVDLLIRHGVSPNIRNRKGDDILETAKPGCRAVIERARLGVYVVHGSDDGPGNFAMGL